MSTEGSVVCNDGQYVKGVYTCDDCGKGVSVEVKKAHVFAEGATYKSTTATCTDAGVEYYECTACKELVGKNVAAYGHNHAKLESISDEYVSEGVKLIEELKKNADNYVREDIPLSELKVGLKCGGSDGYSGITANPLVGRASDRLIKEGASCILTEVPEMFGAEQILMNRCTSKEVFDKTVALINDFKGYFKRHGQVIYENPSPGNKAGGITTLEEKSLGCVQKAGSSAVVDVLSCGEKLTKNGLSLLTGPGNDIVAITNLMASGVHVILFTTGRGTPLGSAVPTVKIATNKALADKKSSWIDFDASPTLDGKDLSEELVDFIVEVASGKLTKNEINGYREISIFKDGVTL